MNIQEQIEKLESELAALKLKLAEKGKSQPDVPEFVEIEGGTLELDDGRTLEVDDFEISSTQVTVGQWMKFVEESSYEWKGVVPEHATDDHPIVNVTWIDAMAFCAHYGFDLPHEDEWEYACRAGDTGEACSMETELDDYCWYDDNSGGQSRPVATKKPNRWGLYDMLGNVWEWCSNVYS